ncbi:MAG TPA: hypothetical protein VIH27_04575, partial [Nitrososphaerales archaeon]
LLDIHTIPDTKDRLRRSCQFPLIKHIAFLEVTYNVFGAPIYMVIGMTVLIYVMDYLRIQRRE